ncbi:MAG: hypothetical protein SO253_00760 [Bacilli bacterium]|nr:hypothetical protein [Bacilli bacterium]
MDYETTKTCNRNEARLYAMLFRATFDLPQKGPVNPLQLLDSMSSVEGFEHISYEIVYGNSLPGNVPARGYFTEDGGYHIEIKESVYKGAYEKETGGYYMHILHEIVHPFVDKLGFKPIFSREVTKDTPAYKRLEWIVMAIAGEIMMPYEETQGLTIKELMKKYHVSKSAAEKRLTY